MINHNQQTQMIYGMDCTLYSMVLCRNELFVNYEDNIKIELNYAL